MSERNLVFTALYLKFSDGLSRAHKCSINSKHFSLRAFFLSFSTHTCKNIFFIEKYQSNVTWTFKQNSVVDTASLYPTPPSFKAGRNEWMNQSILQLRTQIAYQSKLNIRFAGRYGFRTFLVDISALNEMTNQFIAHERLRCLKRILVIWVRIEIKFKVCRRLWLHSFFSRYFHSEWNN